MEDGLVFSALTLRPRFFSSFFYCRFSFQSLFSFFQCDVLNRGFSGYTTDLADRLAFEWAFNSDQQPLFVTVFFGANDAALPFSVQHVPVERYRDNLTTIVRRLKSKWPNLTILLISPPPVDDEKWRRNCANMISNRLKENTRLYRNAAADVAQDEKTIFVDLFDGRFDDMARLLNDGLHLTEAGNEVLFRAVLEKLPDQVLTTEPAFPHCKNKKSVCFVVVNFFPFFTPGAKLFENKLGE